ncbi:MAG: hypothetical protein ACI4B3_00650 [Prevotella sp.]
MAYIDRRRNKNGYPFQGTFYIKGEPTVGDGGDLFSDGAGEVKDTIVLETKCDVTETNGVFTSGAIAASYDVYFPLKKGEIVMVERGQMFKSDVNGINVIGMVVSVGLSQLGGVHAYIKSTEV